MLANQSISAFAAYKYKLHKIKKDSSTSVEGRKSKKNKKSAKSAKLVNGDAPPNKPSKDDRPSKKPRDKLTNGGDVAMKQVSKKTSTIKSDTVLVTNGELPKKKKSMTKITTLSITTDTHKKKRKNKKQKPKPITSSNKKRKLKDDPPLLEPIEFNEPGRFVKKPRTDEPTDDETSSVMYDLHRTDPSTEGLKMFKWLVSPLDPMTFFSRYWEKDVLYIARDAPNYNKHLLSSQRLDDIFREYPLYYNRNVDVVSYDNGIKEVHNEEGRVIASGLYDYYSNGCSVRVLNPQTYDQKVHLLISALQEYFGTMVGTNVYLTPPGSQGFAPHYDDIEAFIVQLEGRKHWKLYKPPKNEILARYSSKNLKSEDIGEPFLEVTLNAGDLLYFPRGTIHEGRTDEDAHSLHITVSVYQRNAFIDLLELAVPEALKRAANEDIEFRRGMPVNYLRHLGEVNKFESETRFLVTNKVVNLMDKLTKYLDIDEAVDKLGRRFIYDSMPPLLSKHEVNYTSKYDGDYLKDGKVYNRVEIDLITEVRLVRFHCLRLVIEEGSPILFYNTDNAKVYHGEDEQSLSIDKALIPGIQHLQNSYPAFIQVEDLPLDGDIAKMQLVSDLWERGLLVTKGPLPPQDDSQNDEGELNV